MEFNSMDELLDYVAEAVQSQLTFLGDDMVKIMDDELMGQTGYHEHEPTMYKRTKGFEEICQKNVADGFVEGVFADNGEWEDSNGEDYFPLERWESGTVYAPGYRSSGRRYPKTNIVEVSFQKIDEKIPQNLADRLKMQGLDVL